MLPASVPAENRPYKVLGDVKGEACSRHVLFIPISLSEGLGDAYQDATRSGADGLIGMTVDVTWAEFVLYGFSCTTVRGKAIQFMDKDTGGGGKYGAACGVDGDCIEGFFCRDGACAPGGRD
jgi:hypothetical protein